jgi:hypothetical protein
VVHRRTEYEALLDRHGTPQQAEFFLRTRGQEVDEVLARHELVRAAIATATAGIPTQWRRAEVERADLARFVFGPEDVVVVVGQDGLVANVAKYLDGQPVVGIDPDPGSNPGVLVPHAPADAGRLLLTATGGEASALQRRTMVEATTDDGQVLAGLNELYIGHPSHQSARYVLEVPGVARERQSSSGILAGTGTGATGWLRSAWQERRSALQLPGPTDAELCWFVREAWPSPATGTEHTEGLIREGEVLVVHAESDQLVCFGDGIEADAIVLSWGQRLEVRRATRCLRLVVG